MHGEHADGGRGGPGVWCRDGPGVWGAEEGTACAEVEGLLGPTCSPLRSTITEPKFSKPKHAPAPAGNKHAPAPEVNHKTHAHWAAPVSTPILPGSSSWHGPCSPSITPHTSSASGPHPAALPVDPRPPRSAWSLLLPRRHSRHSRKGFRLRLLDRMREPTVVAFGAEEAVLLWPWGDTSQRSSTPASPLVIAEFKQRGRGSLAGAPGDCWHSRVLLCTLLERYGRV
jgi:hypothetical protein